MRLSPAGQFFSVRSFGERRSSVAHKGRAIMAVAEPVVEPVETKDVWSREQGWGGSR